MANRKLQKEIEIVFKKVDEGVVVFEQIWDKVYSAATPAQKEKYEGDLKKEIKKLQRLRDQIKSWQGDSSIKDKTKLDSYRKLIESKMEKFKICEKETKTKAFSKEGLQLDRTDPKERAKQEVGDWVADFITRLGDQLEELEAELEAIKTQGKKKKGGTGTASEKSNDVQSTMERHVFHQDMLEKVLRAVHNETITPEQANDIKDSIEYYLDSNQDPDFMDDDTLYDDLDLDAVPASAFLSKKEEEDTAAAAAAGVEIDELNAQGSARNAAGKDIPRPPTSNNVAKVATLSSSPSASPSILNASSAVSIPRKTAARPGPVQVGGSAPEPKGSENARLGSSPAAKSSMKAPSATSSENGVKAVDYAAAAAASGVDTITPPLAFSSIVKGSAPSAVSAVATGTTPTLASVPAAVPGRAPSPMVSAAPAPVPSPAPAQAAQGGSASPKISATGMHPSATNAPHAGLRAGMSSSPTPSTAVGHESAAQAGGQAQGASMDPFDLSGMGSSGLRGASASAASAMPKDAPDAERAGLSSAQALEFALRTGMPVSAESEFASMKRKQGLKQANGHNSVNTPACFPQKMPPNLENEKVFERFGPETLFYVFYYQPGTLQQYLAAKQLKKQNWRFHKKYCTWFQRHVEPTVLADDFEQGTYVYFDYVLRHDTDVGWLNRYKADFRFEYQYLEDELT